MKVIKINKKSFITLAFLGLLWVLFLPTSAWADSAPTVKTVGGSDWEVFNAVEQTLDGGYVVVGHSNSNNGDLEGLNKKYSDALIVKFSASGEIQWVKTFGGSLIDSFKGVRQTKDGGYIAVGSSSSIDMDMDNSYKKIREGEQDTSNVDAIIVKFNDLGDVEWSKDFGGSKMDIYNGVVETEAGDFFVVGESESSDGDMADLSKGNSDAIYAHYNPNGEFLAAYAFGGTSSDGFNSVAELTDGSFVAVGYSSSRDRDLQGSGASLLKGIIVKIGKDLSIPWSTAVDFTDPEYQRLVYSSGNGFQDVKTTGDNGFIAVGKGTYIDRKEDGSGNMNEDGRIYKFDSAGNVEWFDIYTNQAYTRFFGVTQGLDGTYTVVGDSYMPQAKKIIALRYDAHGVRLWDREDEGSRNRYLMSIQTVGSQYVAVGSKYIQGKSDEGLLYIGSFEEINEKLIMTQGVAPNSPSNTSDKIMVEATERLGGDNRYGTAIAISKEGWEKSENVILVNGNNFPDALVGSSFAYLKDAPILITPADELNPLIRDEIIRLGAKTIYILGNYDSISKNLEDHLKQNYQVVRIGGTEVLDTAVKIGEEVRKQKPFDTVIIATQENFPDALAIAPYSAMKNIPILFTHMNELRSDTRKVLKDWGIKNAIVSGGPGAVSLEVDLELDAMGITVTRLGGLDRYETALAIARYFGAVNPPTAISIATGENYPDALTGAVLAAQHETPLILVNKNRAKKTVLEYVNGLSLQKAYIFGGTGVVEDSLLEP